jgi:hypothetical protein
MPLQEQTAKLVDKLIELSEQGKVNWQETAEEDAFLASVGKFVVTAAKADLQYPGYTFTIADQVGRILEEARVEDRGTYEGADHYYSRLAALFEMARRQALKVDEALTEMLSSLEQIR